MDKLIEAWWAWDERPSAEATVDGLEAACKEFCADKSFSVFRYRQMMAEVKRELAAGLWDEQDYRTCVEECLRRLHDGEDVELVPHT